MTAPRASSLIRFSPDGGGSGGADPLESLSVTLTTRLIGLTSRTWAGATGPLDRVLTIAFGPQGVPDPCLRAILAGISPMGHAPLVVTSAGYWASTCGFESPSDPVWYVYSDPAPDDDDPVLAIHLPVENVATLFDWPEALVTFDPPIDEAAGETTPDTWLRLTALEGMNSDSSLQLPMRLMMRAANGVIEHELRTLNYQDAPGFSGADGSVTCNLDPIFAVRSSELAALAQTIGGGEAGEYELWWRIYHGSGRMRYEALCGPEETPIGTYTDTRNAGIGGGFGIFETSALKVADVRVGQKPLAFNLTAGEQYIDTYNLGGPPPIVARELTPTRFSDDWCGDIDGKLVALSWAGYGILAAGRRIWSSYGLGYVLAAGVAKIAATDDMPEHLELRALVGFSTETSVRLFRRALIAGRSMAFWRSIQLPEPPFAPSPQNEHFHFSFAPDGSSIAAFRTPEFYPAVVPGSLYSLDIPETAAEFPAFELVATAPEPQSWLHDPYAVDVEWETPYSYIWGNSSPTPVKIKMWVGVVNVEGFERTGVKVWHDDDEEHYLYTSGLFTGRRYFVPIYGHHKCVIEVKDALDLLPEYASRCEVFVDDEERLSFSMPPGGNLAIENPLYTYIVNECPDEWAGQSIVDVPLACKFTSVIKKDGCLSRKLGQESFTVLQWPFIEHYPFSTEYAPPVWAINGAQYAPTDIDGYIPQGDGKEWTHSITRVTPHACLIAPDPNSARPLGPSLERLSASDLVTAHNEYRAARGLSTLSRNGILDAAIAEHVAWLKANNIVQHEGENGSTPRERALAAGYPDTAGIGENLARGQTSIAQVMAGWDASPGHHANLNDPDWTEIGVAILGCETGGFYFGVLFGYPS